MILEDENDFASGFNEWWANLSEEEKAAMECRHQLEWSRRTQHPLYRKAEEIAQIVDAIIESLPEETRNFHEPVCISARMLAPSFAAGYDSEAWLPAMQTAALIRFHAQYVANGTYGFNVRGTEVDKRYIELLRNEMRAYKKLFSEWLETVNALPRDSDMEHDEWGVFVRAK